MPSTSATLAVAHNNIFIFSRSQDSSWVFWRGLKFTIPRTQKPDDDPKEPCRTGYLVNSLYRPDLIYEVTTPPTLVARADRDARFRVLPPGDSLPICPRESQTGDVIRQAAPLQICRMLEEVVAKHKTDLVQGLLQHHPNVTLHFAPTYSSWLNVEGWSSTLQREVIDCGVSVETFRCSQAHSLLVAMSQGQPASPGNRPWD